MKSEVEDVIKYADISFNSEYNTIKELNKEQKIKEVARMVSGDSMTKISEEHAIEMLKIADRIKEEIKSKSI